MNYSKKPLRKHQKIKNKLEKATEVLNKKIDSELEAIIKIIFSWIANDEKINTKEHQTILINLFYKALENLYSEINIELGKIYTKVAPFNLQNIANLTFQEDGKTLDERIIKYLDDLEEKRLSGDFPDDLKSFSVNMYSRLLNNESKYLFTHLMEMKIRPVASILVIESGTCGDLCSEWNGEYPAGEDIPLPPYHTNCQCSAYYIETDDEDDVNDLDLEVEKIKDI